MAREDLLDIEVVGASGRVIRRAAVGSDGVLAVAALLGRGVAPTAASTGCGAASVAFLLTCVPRAATPVALDQPAGADR